MKKNLRALVVDDEEFCRKDLVDGLQQIRDVQVVAEAANLAEAIRKNETMKPDVLFLDLHLKEQNGLRMIKEISYRPAVIAVTAFTHHAVEGFSLDFADYILKPVETKRLQMAIQRARDQILFSSLKENPAIQLEIDGATTPLTISDIFWVKASENYVEVCSTAGRGLIRSTFTNLKNNLPAGFTLEISRGLIVARHQIKQWRRDPQGHLEVILKCGKVLKVSKRLQKEVLEQLEYLG